MKINYIECSPRGERSHSTKIAQAYIEQAKKNIPDLELNHINPWSLNLPEFDGDMLNAKYSVIRGTDPSADEVSAWSNVKNIFDEFNNADHYLFSVPMWNFNIPYKLKHYIDIITQPGMSWSYTPEDGYKGLMTDKTATIIYSTGDGYGEGTGFESFDMQKPYVNLWLTFLGFKKIERVVVDRTLFDAETAEKNALDVALKLANINTL
ncbi:MAG: FMN-dependent NADH-azoreductase 2 [Ectothiorhodospiraceae bacterium]|nr:MAG: FMN-dependent NADH-azoreductase 2 [Ectothiorhodospiraceae bacterium]